ncbi:hypothetical protein [Nannocystis punicea]|uniref:Uncharacterized protein n=1 Tax=Nannocystis punicea TaxID=2995304 RepID=A0ABY7HF59_9BACT|nr:hypothetical protein [Nannocystis poenicansa]WAS97773.1 hypothetical protein O0S08_16645 [Nannocystis poenicansa]
MSGGDYMRAITDVGEWIWGVIRGGFNEQQSVSQIIVDAIIGMIPLVGDATAVRDLLAVVIRLADHPERRQETMQWIELVICLFALIPVAGGAIKGVGRLLARVGRNAAEAAPVLREAIELLNRVGSGNAVRFMRELDLSRYTAELQGQFRRLVGRVTTTIDAIMRRGRLILPNSMTERLRELRAAMQQLGALGDRMIPQAVRDLNGWLRTVQRHMYAGTYHEIPSSLRAETREFERGLIRERRLPRPNELPFPPSTIANYRHRVPWPDLRQGNFHNPASNPYRNIRTFSGNLQAVELRHPRKIYRIIENEGGRAGAFWSLEKPPNGRRWREDYAVLESWNRDGHYIEFEIPPGFSLYVWQGKVASQVETDAAKATYGQVLNGGAQQLLIDLRHRSNAWALARVEALPLHRTGWRDHMGVNVPNEQTRAILLGQAERAARVGNFTAVTRVTGAGVRGSQAQQRQQQPRR